MYRESRTYIIAMAAKVTPRQAMGSVPNGTGFFYFIGEGWHVGPPDWVRTLVDAAPVLKTVMIVHNAAGVPAELTQGLSRSGYEIAATASASSDVLPIIKSVRPQLVLMANDPPYTGLFRIVREIIALRMTAIVLLMDEWDASLAKQAMDSGASGYMLKPFDTPHVNATLESSWHHFQKLIALQDNLEMRKLVERAKGVLMDEHFITEEEAHQTLLKMSQDQSIPLKEVCLSIVHVKSILGKDKLRKD